MYSTLEEALEVLKVGLVQRIAERSEQIIARDTEVAIRDAKKKHEWEVGMQKFMNATREEKKDKYESPYS